MVETLAAIIESRGLKHKPVAEQAWPYKKAAFRTWQAMRNGDSPQKLTIRDAYSMAQVLGISLSALCGMVEGQILGIGMPLTKVGKAPAPLSPSQACSSKENSAPAACSNAR